MDEFLETVASTYNASRGLALSGDYEGVTHAGLAVVALDTGRALLAQRALDKTDDPDVQETWEWPGGSLDGDEEPYEAALREFSEEVALELPLGMVVNGWRAGPEENYQGFVYTVGTEFDLSGFVPNVETQAVAWVDMADTDLSIRPEMADFDISLLDVSGNEEDMPETLAAGAQVGTSDEYVQVDEDLDEETLDEPEIDIADLDYGPLLVHGILAPEDVATGDGRGFNDGSMTARPGRLPFSWQIESNPGHDKSVVVGSVDRLMRHNGVIYWEGQLMDSSYASEFAELLAFFGRFGVSVDGDNGLLDEAKTDSTGVTWFEAVRASGLTAVHIPAFAEAYVAFGPHPDMPPRDEQGAALTASLTADGDLVTFDRGPGWVTNPEETRRIHAYWTKKGQPGYAKIGWGTRGDFTRAKKLIGAKIAANSPEDMKYLNQIIARWHHDALGYWPGDLDMPGNKTSAEAKAERAAKAASHGLVVETDEMAWEAVLTASVSGNTVRPPVSYFHRQEDMGALVISDPDENGFRHTYGYAGEWGVCHIGMAGQCVEPPQTFSDDYPRFHLGRTKTEDGYVNTGVLTYGVGHRDADTILRETPEQAYFDNINNAWAAVRVGEDERGIWFSGVVLPGVPEDHITKIEASGQVSGEWLYGEMSACLTVNVPGFAVQRASAVYDEQGNVVALAASAFNNIDNPPCAEPTAKERIEALRTVDAEVRFAALRTKWATRGEI